MTSAGNIWGTEGRSLMAASRAQDMDQGRFARWREGFRRVVRRSGSFLAGAALCAFALFALAAMISYRPSDPAGGPISMRSRSEVQAPAPGPQTGFSC